MYKRIATIGRFQPITNFGQKLLLQMGCISEEVVIGLGSKGRKNVRNPFTHIERKKMIEWALPTNPCERSTYSFVFLEDNQDEEAWTKEAVEAFGELDIFVCGNPYATKLLKPHYKVVHPKELFKEKYYEKYRLNSSSTEIRISMAKNETDWIWNVPLGTALELFNHGLWKRFIDEFGEETLNRFENEKVNNIPSLNQERNLVMKESWNERGT